MKGKPPNKARGASALSVAIYMPDLSGGGAERQCLCLAGELHRRGLAITLVLHRLQGDLLNQLPPGLRVVALNGRRTLHDILLLARYLRRERPDILLTNLDHNNVAGLLAKIVAASRTQVVIYQHNALAGEFAASERWSYRAIPLAYRLLSPFMAAAVAVSNGIARELVVAAGVPPAKIVTIHNAIIKGDFWSRANEPATIPWFDEEQRPLLVTAGRLVPQKDYETLIRALAIHRGAGGRGRLAVIGSGPLQDALQTLAHDLKIGDAVAFPGFQANPLPWFLRADAFVLSSSSEGFGNVLVEAMGCGTPVISTDCDHGPREILQDGRYGVLVPLRDPSALAEAIDQATTLRSRFPADLLKERAAAFSDEACTAAFLALFDNLIPRKSTARSISFGAGSAPLLAAQHEQPGQQTS
jgi:glycosyltransferase involved in cell wall biosynthesis